MWVQRMKKGWKLGIGCIEKIEMEEGVRDGGCRPFTQMPFDPSGEGGTHTPLACKTYRDRG
jgi:hypothetical protein